MITQNIKPSVSIRLVSMLVDHFIMSFIIFVISFVIMSTLFFIKGNKIDNPTLIAGSFVTTTVLVILSIYFNKDVINGRSPAKRILKLQVVDKATEVAASPMKCLLRNLTIIVWPVEVVATIFNPSQRLGDKLVNTKVIYFDELKELGKINKKSVLKAFLTGLLLSFFLSILYILLNL